jgi:hypothetical protein
MIRHDSTLFLHTYSTTSGATSFGINQTFIRTCCRASWRHSLNIFTRQSTSPRLISPATSVCLPLRGGLFAMIVKLMDVEVLPSSNPYAWLRLTAAGLRKVVEDEFSDGEQAEAWIERSVAGARKGETLRFPIKFVEAMTNALPPEYYREGEAVRSVKRDLGLRRASQVLQPLEPSQPKPTAVIDFTDAFRNLSRVSSRSPEPVLRTAARSLQEYLQ